MAPVKFDDLSKVASSILNDDYQVSGYKLKTKQASKWHGASLSSEVELLADEKSATPTKLTVAMPKPFGKPWFAITKLEMDKNGKFKLETSKGDITPGLKVEVKSDLADINKVSVSKTYTGIKDAQLKVDYKLLTPADFTAEATYQKGSATCGIKLTNAVLKGGLPDFGVRFLSGPLFCSLLATMALKTYSFNASYTCCPPIRVAVAGQGGQKGLESASAAVEYKSLYKVKASMDGSVSLSAKHVIAKGVDVLGGFKYSTSKGTFSYGCQVTLA